MGFLKHGFDRYVQKAKSDPFMVIPTEHKKYTRLLFLNRSCITFTNCISILSQKNIDKRNLKMLLKFKKSSSTFISLNKSIEKTLKNSQNF
jgi:hypothetical protein